jgi:hypothetical protein
MNAYTDAERWCDRLGFNDPGRLTSDKGHNLRDRLSRAALRCVTSHHNETFLFSDHSAIHIYARGHGGEYKWGIEV